jgi:putative ABC transport system permease protein
LAPNDEQWYTVVGVAGQVHQESLSHPTDPEIYLPLSRYTYHDLRTAVTIRAGLPVEQIARALRAAVWEIDRTLPIPSISRAEDQVASDLQNPRFFALLGSAFSLSAVVLTLAAIFGLMSYWVTARTREVGLRIALGARAGQVLWAVQRQCLRMVFLGLGVGLVLAAGASRLLSTFLFQVSPLDPSTFALVAAGLGVAALFASLVPALRATRVDPANTLRWE